MRSVALSTCLVLAFCFAGANAQGWKSNWVTPKTPVIIPIKAGVTTYGLLNVGDSVPNTAVPGTSYRLVGLPDGMGIWRINNTKFGMVMNHELGSTNGIVRRHGAAGAFVSKWIIDSKTLKIDGGEDLIQEVYLWNATTSAYVKTAYAFGRFCSANLAPVSAFYDAATKTGTQDLIFMNGEEIGSTIGKAFAHIVTGPFAGKSYEIATMGPGSYENVIANPYTGTKTVLIGSDDAGPPNGKLNVLVGTKQACAAGDNPVKCAGLLDAVRYYIRIPSIVNNTEPLTTAIPGISADVGLDFDLVSSVASGTAFQRPEDCHWDPVDRNTFFCAMTASFTGRTRVWKFTFTDVTALAASPAIAGKAYIVVEGDPNGAAASNPRMVDNLVAYNGGVFLQEDPGNQAYVARLWRYCNANKVLEPIATFDPALFTSGLPGFLTQDEESSGIINLDIAVGYAKNCFLLDAQIHRTNPDAELVEDGQILVMCLPLNDTCPGVAAGQRLCPTK